MYTYFLWHWRILVKVGALVFVFVVVDADLPVAIIVACLLVLFALFEDLLVSFSCWQTGTTHHVRYLVWRQPWLLNSLFLDERSIKVRVQYLDYIWMAAFSQYIDLCEQALKTLLLVL